MAATRRRVGGDPPPLWRELEHSEKFRILANHYGTAENFAAASGIPVKTLRSIFSVIDSGRHSRVLERDDIKHALRRSRHRMTDKVRRVNKAAQESRYSAPLARSGFSLIEPQKLQLEYLDTGKVVDSYWTTYSVEYLSEKEILNVAQNLFEVFSDTGQFNSFRFEYLAEASQYTGGRIFKDRALRNAAKEMDYIKISSRIIPFPEFEMNSRAFREYVQDAYNDLKPRGAIRLTDLAFTKFDDVEKGMQRMREALQKGGAKRKQNRGFKNGGSKKGRGYK